MCRTRPEDQDILAIYPGDSLSRLTFVDPIQLWAGLVGHLDPRMAVPRDKKLGLWEKDNLHWSEMGQVKFAGTKLEVGFVCKGFCAANSWRQPVVTLSCFVMSAATRKARFGKM